MCRAKFVYPNTLKFGTVFVILHGKTFHNMNEQSINETYQSIVSLLKQRRLKEAHTQLQPLTAACGDYTLQSRLEQDSTAYRYMLQYMRQGSEDAGRHALYLRLCANTWEMAEQARLMLLDNISPHYYHSLRRNQRITPPTPLDELLHTQETFNDDMSLCQLMPQDRKMLDATLERHENACQHLFLNTWTNSAWSAGEIQTASQFLTSDLLAINDLCLLTSAVTLSLLECFDPHKMKWLLDAARHENQRIVQRALVGLVLVIHAEPDRIPFYPALTAQFSLLKEEPGIKTAFTNLYIQLLRSQETEKIDRKMREEIIPEMLKNVNLMRNMKFGFEDAAEENDFNPDWEKAFEQSGLNDKIREMNELQMEGSDVYMSTFAQLKNFPFFSSLPNWFYPFDMRHSSMVREFGLTPEAENSMMVFLLQAGFFCDSDKYSLAFTMSHIPQSQRGIMFSQMTSQDMEELMDEKKVAGFKQYAERPEVISNQYIHNLYRFFKLYPHRREMHDPFQDDIALHRIPLLADILDTPEALKAVADFHFSKEHPSQALELYNRLSAMARADAEVYQKMGYCHQKGKNYSEAVKAYLKADVLKPDHVWTLRHLATCYRQMHQFEKALDYYHKVEAIQPENSTILFHIGSCLAELEHYEEALQYFFRLELMESGSIKVWRAIAWCSFVCGKLEQSDKYYHHILDSSTPVAADYLNAGHVAWKTGNMARAAALYGQALHHSESRSAFIDMLFKDKDILGKMGLNTEDLPLMADLAEEA